MNSQRLRNGYHERTWEDGRLLGAVHVKQGRVARLFITRRGFILYWLAGAFDPKPAPPERE